MVYILYHQCLEMRACPHRDAIAALLQSGESKAAISRKLKINKRTIQRLAKQLKMKGHVKEARKSGRTPTVDTARMRKIIKQRIDRNDERSLNQMAKELKISRGSVQNIVKKKLGLRSYRLSKGQFLTDELKASRLQKSKHLLQFFKTARIEDVLWSDEKIFTIEVAHNPQNHRQLMAPDQKKTLKRKIRTRALFPKGLMVWGGVTAKAKTPLVFIDKNVKINAKVYQNKVLHKVVIPLQRKNPQMIFQQDWAPAHRAKSTMALMRRKLPSHLTRKEWPSNSPDLNPLDFSIWGCLEESLKSKKITNLAELKKELIAAWANLDVKYLRATVDSVVPRLKACVKAKGGNFENLL